MALRSKTRPGPPESFVPKTGMQAVINILVRRHGGLYATAEYISQNSSKAVYYYDVNNWRKRGVVPLSHITAVSRVFEVSPYLLNFTKLAEARSTQPNWRKLVIETFEPNDAQQILKLTAPKLKVSTK